jgi:hypothetical protein
VPHENRQRISATLTAGADPDDNLVVTPRGISSREVLGLVQSGDSVSGGAASQDLVDGNTARLESKAVAARRCFARPSRAIRQNESQQHQARWKREAHRGPRASATAVASSALLKGFINTVRMPSCITRFGVI